MAGPVRGRGDDSFSGLLQRPGAGERGGYAEQYRHVRRGLPDLNIDWAAVLMKGTENTLKDAGKDTKNAAKDIGQGVENAAKDAKTDMEKMTGK